MVFSRSFVELISQEDASSFWSFPPENLVRKEELDAELLVAAPVTWRGNCQGVHRIPPILRRAVLALDLPHSLLIVAVEDRDNRRVLVGLAQLLAQRPKVCIPGPLF